MTRRSAALLLISFAATLLLISWGIVALFGLRTTGKADGPVVVSVWKGGTRIGRDFHYPGEQPSERMLRIARKGAYLVEETIIDEAPVWQIGGTVICQSFVPGRDGVHVRYKTRDEFITPDDLIARQVLVKSEGFLSWRLVDIEPALAPIAARWRISPSALLEEGTLNRFSVRRRVVARPDGGPDDRPALTELPLKEALHTSIREGAEYLARNQKKNGRFTYQTLATNDFRPKGYNMPRHAGTTLFMAEAAAFLDDEKLKDAARRAARYMLKGGTMQCSQLPCVGRGQGDTVSLGSSALGLLAYTELVETGIGVEFRPQLDGLAEFVLSLQRPDGEFMHLYDRRKNEPVDVQLPFYSGEAALALARAHRVTGKVEHLEAARQVVDYQTAKRWSFFGSQYFFDSEHWTCQAMLALQRRAPSKGALDFCLRWQDFNQAIQKDATAATPAWRGSYMPHPLLPGRFATVGARNEAAAATLLAAAVDGRPERQLRAIEHQLEEGFAFALRHQFSPGASYLLAKPKKMRGAIPGSPADMMLRIDINQHVGSAMIRYLRYLNQKEAGKFELP